MTEKKRLIVSNLLSLILGIGIGFCGYGMIDNGGNPAGKAEPPTAMIENGGAFLEETKSGGVKITSVKIPAEEYDAYGISTQADTAYRITATVMPEDASNKNVSWSLSWKNASSSWASGKTLSSYVTVTSSGTANNVAVLTCKQAFGEQVLLKATAAGDTTKTATCTVDYAQKITNATISFGSVSIANGKTVKPTFPLSAGATGSGGRASMSYTYSSVYTIKDTYSVTYSIVDPGSTLVDFYDYTYSKSSALGTSIQNGSYVYFDISFFKLLGMQVDGVDDPDLILPYVEIGNNTSSYSDAELLKQYFDGKGNTDIDGGIQILATIKGKYSTFSYSGRIGIESYSYANGKSVSDVSLDQSGVVMS